MDDEATTDRVRTTRRGVLALAGTTALAGCQSILGEREDSDTVQAYDLPDIDPEAVPTPVVPRSLPVDITSGHLASSRDRVSELLATLPTPLGPDEIPNGYIRQQLTDAADEATDRLDDARTARTGLEALHAFQHGREEARYAAAGWEMADDGLSTATLQREHRQVVANADTARRNYEYIGTDPVRAAVVHAHIENALAQIINDSEPRTHGHGALLTVAEWGSAAESARATFADVRHVDEQFAETLPDDVGIIGDVFSDAGQQLFDAVNARRADMPPEPTAEDWGVAEHVVDELRWRVVNGPANVDETNGPASAIVDATDLLARARAMGRIEKQIDDGELRGVESGEELRALRTEAYDALERGFDESPAKPLARRVISDASRRVSSGDWQLGRIDRDVGSERLDDIVVDYHVAIAIARSTAETCTQVVDALDMA